MFQPKVGYLHVRSIKRQIDIVYVEVFFSVGAFRAEVLLVIAHPL